MFLNCFFIAVLFFSLTSPFQCICMKWNLPVRVDSESNMLKIKELEHLVRVRGRKDVLKVGFQIPLNLLKHNQNDQTGLQKKDPSYYFTTDGVQ